MTVISKIFVSLGVLIVLLIAFVALFWQQLPIRLILPYIVQSSISIEGTVQKQRIVGTETGEQTFFIYLPKDYEKSNQNYHVLYHLHGAFVQESWVGYECNNIGHELERAVAANIIDPMIVVCLVDPDGDRMWSDSFDGQYLASTALIKDLIPHIDATYRTIPRRNGRALQGFSMGGFGTVTNGFKHPDLFNALIVWDGALHNWQTISTSRQGITSKMFDSEAYFNEWSPDELVKQSVDVEMDMFVVVGEMDATRSFASRFIPQIENLGRAFTYQDVACPHSLFCMMEQLNSEAFRFLANSFSHSHLEQAKSF